MSTEEAKKPKKKARFSKSGILRGFVSLLIVFSIPVLLMLSDYIKGYFAFDKIYSQGDRSGQVIKITQKGLYWRTWEIGVGLTQSGAYVDLMNFSVDEWDPNKDQLLAKLQEAYEKGSIVKIKYIQRYGIVPWRGSSEYFIQDITIMPNAYEEFVKDMEKRDQEYFNSLNQQRR